MRTHRSTQLHQGRELQVGREEGRTPRGRRDSQREKEVREPRGIEFLIERMTNSGLDRHSGRT